MSFEYLSTPTLIKNCLNILHWIGPYFVNFNKKNNLINFKVYINCDHYYVGFVYKMHENMQQRKEKAHNRHLLTYFFKESRCIYELGLPYYITGDN